MIHRPHRSVTRFFVPLIDVMILLFSVSLLIPPGTNTTPVEADDATPPVTASKGPPLPTDVKQLQAELEKARAAAERLRAERRNLAERLSICVLEIDPADGRLFLYSDGRRVDIPERKAAGDLIDLQKTRAGLKEPFFMILLPPVAPEATSRYPTRRQLTDIEGWFKGTEFAVNNR